MKQILFCFTFFLSVLYCFSQQPAFVADSMDAYINRGLKEWNIPGLAVAVVKDGKVVFMKGYGIRQVGKPDKVDENTLFMIASNTKLFTGTALANLEAQKKLSLDDHVSKYIPGFRLYDENSSRIVSIRDILSHRIGTKTFQGDFTFWNSTLPREEIINRMRLLKPPFIFRQDLGYCNSCFLTAGQIIPVVTGHSWSDYIQENFLTPLGMSNTYPLTKDFDKRVDIAHPYTNTFGELKEVPFDSIDNFAPAAGIVSNVKDLSKWLIMQLDSGRYNGKQIVPWSVVQKTRDINTISGSRKSSVYPSHFRGYGLGVFMTDYNGRMVYYHTGGADGFVTNTCFVPEENLGITILTNNDNNIFFEALRYQILDAYLGVPYTNRDAFYLKYATAENAETMAGIDTLNLRAAAGNKPAVELSAFAGNYNNTLFGDIHITQKGSRLLISFDNHPHLTATLQYMDHNEFLLTYSHPGYGIFPAKFTIENGKVKSVLIKVNDFLEYDPYLFKKK